MKCKNNKTIILLLGLLFSTVLSMATNNYHSDGVSNIDINQAKVQGAPKDSSIQASIDGHMLSVVFLENLGSVLVEVTDANGGTVDVVDMYTPNGYTAYIFGTGSYIVNFTLENGDEYYGEFEVTE